MRCSPPKLILISGRPQHQNKLGDKEIGFGIFDLRPETPTDEQSKDDHFKDAFGYWKIWVLMSGWIYIPPSFLSFISAFAIELSL